MGWWKAVQRGAEAQQKAEDVSVMGRQVPRPWVWRVSHFPVRTKQTLKLGK